MLYVRDASGETVAVEDLEFDHRGTETFLEQFVVPAKIPEPESAALSCGRPIDRVE